jgi:hypothetical protein
MSVENLLRQLQFLPIDGTKEGWIGDKEKGVGAIIAWGPTLPTDADPGYSPGCIFIHIDGTDGTALYVNEGTIASCDFNLITVASA